MVESDERIFIAGQAAVSPGLILYGLSMAGVVPPISGRLARSWDHPCDQDERIDRKPISHQRYGEAAVRLANDDQVVAVTDGIDHGVGVLR
jgi:hypothetical protein